VALGRDRHVLVVDLALDVAVDGLEEVLAVPARVEAEDVGLQHARAAAPRFHGHTPKVSAFGHGMCQNITIVAPGTALADAPAAARSGSPG
jgi:hypothetical protein